MLADMVSKRRKTLFIKSSCTIRVVHEAVCARFSSKWYARHYRASTSICGYDYSREIRLEARDAKICEHNTEGLKSMGHLSQESLATSCKGQRPHLRKSISLR
jgi:hypothetical protein